MVARFVRVCAAHYIPLRNLQGTSRIVSHHGRQEPQHQFFH